MKLDTGACGRAGGPGQECYGSEKIESNEREPLPGAGQVSIYIQRERELLHDACSPAMYTMTAFSRAFHMERGGLRAMATYLTLP